MKKRTGRRKYGKSISRRYRRRVRRSSKRRIPIVMPNSYLTKLRYVETFGLDGAAAQSAVHVFRANGLFDPNMTGGGHQPKGFDQIALFWKRFHVLGSRIRVSQYDLTNASISPYALWGVGLSNTGTSFSARALDDILEGEKSTQLIRLAGNVNTNSLIGPVKRTVATVKFSAKKFFGKSAVHDIEYSCTNAADPTIQAYFEVWAVGDGTSNPGTMLFLAQIEYIVLCDEPIFLSQS